MRNHIQAHFDYWWERCGKSLDPDTEDVSWYDKRKAFAALVFDAAMAIASTYTADDDTDATEFYFADGRIVCVKADGYLGIRSKQ